MKLKKSKAIRWVQRNSIIQDSNGAIHFELKNVESPDFWSQTAVDIAASKYFRKKDRNRYLETSVHELIVRILCGLETAFKISAQFKNKKELNSILEQLYNLFVHQKAAMNSPVWFNCGLSERYKLKSESHHFSWNSKLQKIIQIHDAYKNPQLSACFIQSIQDSLDSIFNLVKAEAQLFKYGSGSGTNFTPLRSKYESLNSGGTSSGLMSFLDVLDRSAGAIKSGGTTRRAAKMVCLDVSHPEILEFIKWKRYEEKKAKDLISLGYSSDLDGEAYRTISGQNANNSVRVTNQFMKAVENNLDWNLKTKSGKTLKTVKAQEIWNELCLSAWECADPGLQFDDTINQYHTCSTSGRIKASNPCSEFMFLDDTACNLASLNLVQFYNPETHFDLESFKSAIDVLIQTQDAIIDYSSYPTEKIACNSHDFRPLGLGFANLGSLMMRMGLSYESNEARAWAGALSALLTGQAYLKSAELAGKLGSFKQYSKNKKSMLKVLGQHQKALKKISWEYLSSEFKNEVESVWKNVFRIGKKYGFRNSQVTAIAPTGTIGFVMDCDTTGIEPEFSLVKTKKLSGGGHLKIVNRAVEVALKNLKYSDQDITKISKWILDHQGSLRNCSEIKKEHIDIFKTAVGDLTISAEGHLLMMAAVQPFISGAISKTVNISKESTVEDISEIYFKSWSLQLKSISLYRDQSKFIQPLNTGIKKSEFPKCTECGGETSLESGCFRCQNCGQTTSCAG